MIMHAYVNQDGRWSKVEKEFISTYEDLDGQLTDRVFDGNNKILEEFLTEECTEQDGTYVLTLQELLSLPWDREIFSTGYITEWQYRHLKEDGVKPVYIMKRPLGEVVSKFYMDMIMEHPELRQSRRYFLEYKHNTRAVRECCEFFCNTSIGGLIKLIPECGTTDDVMIAFTV